MATPDRKPMSPEELWHRVNGTLPPERRVERSRPVSPMDSYFLEHPYFGFGLVFVVLFVAIFGTLFVLWLLNSGKREYVPTPRSQPNFDVDQATEQVMDNIMSTPEGRADVEYFGGKDVALTRFQETNGISDRVAEAAIKEWFIKHNGNFDWNLEEVKAICLRNKRSGIPHDYLPESEK